MLSPYLRLVRAGYRRRATYLAASLSGLFANTVFGLLRSAVLLAAVAASTAGDGTAAGYDAAAASTYVWLGQGLLTLVLLWPDGELAARVRSGDVAVDLGRPWDLQAAYLAEDLGRAGHATVFRFVPPVAFGALLLPFRWPTSAAAVAFVGSVLLAVVISAQCRFLLDLSAFWLLDNRGLQTAYIVSTGLLAGLVVPLGFLPEPVRAAFYATPFPSIIQMPIDVFTERAPAAGLLSAQLAWCAGLLVAGHLVLRRATAKLVVQGG